MTSFLKQLLYVILLLLCYLGLDYFFIWAYNYVIPELQDVNKMPWYLLLICLIVGGLIILTWAIDAIERIVMLIGAMIYKVSSAESTRVIQVLSFSIAILNTLSVLYFLWFRKIDYSFLIVIEFLLISFLTFRINIKLTASMKDINDFMRINDN